MAYRWEHPNGRTDVLSITAFKIMVRLMYTDALPAEVCYPAELVRALWCVPSNTYIRRLWCPPDFILKPFAEHLQGMCNTFSALYYSSNLIANMPTFFFCISSSLDGFDCATVALFASLKSQAEKCSSLIYWKRKTLYHG